MKAILSRTTSDMTKSKIKSPRLAEFVLEVYITPTEFAKIIEKYDDKVFEIEFKDGKGERTIL
jgi:hypothetical protein